MSDQSFPYIPLVMSHDKLAGTHDIPLADGYSIRLFQPGEEHFWVDIAVSAEEFKTRSEALAYFDGHFGPYIDAMADRCLFLLDSLGRPVGTSTGWFMDEDASVGRLHWVCIAAEYQGRGLCKPMVAETMRLMAELGHETGVLTTQPSSWKGIKVYLALGWKPYDDGCADFAGGWEIVHRAITPPIL